jgi:hypothetical protein
MFWDQEKLRNICRGRQMRPAAELFGVSVDDFMRRVVIPRQKKLGQLGQAWQELLPAELQEHSCLEDFRRGSLRVLVDSGVHYAELSMLVRAGLADDLRQKCPTVPISRIKLLRGQWYRKDEEGNKIAQYPGVMNRE